jgi:hypothetical protein
MNNYFVSIAKKITTIGILHKLVATFRLYGN